MSKKNKNESDFRRWFLVQAAAFILLMLLCALAFIAIQNTRFSKQYEESMSRMTVIEEKMIQLNSELQAKE